MKQNSALVNELFPYRKWNLKKASEAERSRKDVITYTRCPSGPENQQRCWHRRWHVQLGERNTENNFNLCTRLWRSCMLNYSTYFNNACITFILNTSTYYTLNYNSYLPFKCYAEYDKLWPCHLTIPPFLLIIINRHYSTWGAELNRAKVKASAALGTLCATLQERRSSSSAATRWACPLTPTSAPCWVTSPRSSALTSVTWT